jgi:hypothetical protein
MIGLNVAFKSIRYSFPFATHLILGALIIYIDTIVLSSLSNLSDVALYQSGMRIIMASLLVSVIISDAFIPIMSNLNNDTHKAQNIMLNLFELILVFLILLVITLFYFKNTIILLLYSLDYIELERYFIYIIGIITLRYIGIVPGILLTSSGKQNIRAKAVIFSVVCSVILNYLFIPLFNIEGAFLSSFFAHLILNIIYLYYGLKVINFIKTGLKDLSISRKAFSWGIKVPNNEDHVIYVWLDALTNYISALNYPDTNDVLYKDFWPASVHLIGKDILRFHAIYWPAFLMAANIPLPKKIYGHGWILSGDEKMSKSKGNILDPLDIIDTYGLDPLRYYLIKEVSFGNDGNISKNKLEDCINSDLANNYGNLCQRVTAFAEKNCSSKIPATNNFNKEDLTMLNKFTDNLSILRKEIDKQNVNFYIKFIVNSLFDANKYFNDQEPWKKKEDIPRLNTIVYTSLEMIRKISFMLYPIIPDSINKALKIFNLKTKDIVFETIGKHDYLKSGNDINRIPILFKKIEKIYD